MLKITLSVVAILSLGLIFVFAGDKGESSKSVTAKSACCSDNTSYSVKDASGCNFQTAKSEVSEPDSPCVTCPDGNSMKKTSIGGISTPKTANLVGFNDNRFQVRDAVSGSTLYITENTPYTDYNDYRYYFENDECRMKFVADPAKYTDLKQPAG